MLVEKMLAEDVLMEKIASKEMRTCGGGEDVETRTCGMGVGRKRLRESRAS